MAASTITPDMIDGARRNTYSLVPGAGQAASHRVEVPGVLANDQSHQAEVDGHEGSGIALHPNGRFARNTAATSEYSLNANVAHYKPPATGYSRDPRTGRRLVDDRKREVSASELLFKRDKRLEGEYDSELMIKTAQYERSRRMSFFTQEWTAPQLGLGALALYALVR